jgi:hypothetical protein
MLDASRENGAQLAPREQDPPEAMIFDGGESSKVYGFASIMRPEFL